MFKLLQNSRMQGRPQSTNLWFSVNSCKYPGTMVRTFNIPANAHYSDGWHFRIFLGLTQIHFRARLHESCLYTPIEIPGQINKLFGLAFGRHHNSSGRVGWRSDGKQIELLSYVYTDKNIRIWRSFGTFDANQWHEFKIRRDKHNLSIELIGGIKHHFHLVNPMPWGYWLFPYFGGKIPAPHEMMVDVEVLECDGKERG